MYGSESGKNQFYTFGGLLRPFNRKLVWLRNGRYWKILIKNTERNILYLTQNFLNDTKINVRIQIIPAKHSFSWKTTF